MMTDLVIEIQGGVLQSVYTNDESIRVALIDWDDINDGPSVSSELSFPTDPIDSMPGETSALFLNSKIEH